MVELKIERSATPGTAKDLGRCHFPLQGLPVHGKGSGFTISPACLMARSRTRFAFHTSGTRATTWKLRHPNLQSPGPCGRAIRIEDCSLKGGQSNNWPTVFFDSHPVLLFNVTSPLRLQSTLGAEGQACAGHY